MNLIYLKNLINMSLLFCLTFGAISLHERFFNSFLEQSYQLKIYLLVLLSIIFILSSSLSFSAILKFVYFFMKKKNFFYS